MPMSQHQTIGLAEPAVDISLVEWLERIYPPMEATPETEHLELVFHSGRRDLIQFLRIKAKQQERRVEASRQES